MLALVETAQFVSPDLPLQPGLLHRILERQLQLPAILSAAA
jgi:hypothetical protein